MDIDQILGMISWLLTIAGILLYLCAPLIIAKIFIGNKVVEQKIIKRLCIVNYIYSYLIMSFISYIEYGTVSISIPSSILYTGVAYFILKRKYVQKNSEQTPVKSNKKIEEPNQQISLHVQALNLLDILQQDNPAIKFVYKDVRSDIKIGGNGFVKQMEKGRTIEGIVYTRIFFRTEELLLSGKYCASKGALNSDGMEIYLLRNFVLSKLQNLNGNEKISDQTVATIQEKFYKKLATVG